MIKPLQTERPRNERHSRVNEVKCNETEDRCGAEVLPELVLCVFECVWKKPVSSAALALILTQEWTVDGLILWVSVPFIGHEMGTRSPCYLLSCSGL